MLVDEEDRAWHGGPGEFDEQGVGVYSPAHFPSGSVLGARGKGVSEEGGRSRESRLLSRELSKK
jgi:hypothetical protein